MKAILFIVVLLVVIVAFTVLQGRVSRIASSGAEITGVDWRPTSVGDLRLPDDSDMRIRFEVDGSISGHGGCNGFFGSFQQTDSGMEVGPLGATRMACPEEIMSRETAFLEAVQATRSFDSGRDNVRLLDENGEVLAELVPA